MKLAPIIGLKRLGYLAVLFYFKRDIRQWPRVRFALSRWSTLNGSHEIVPSTPAEPSAAGIGGVWAKARQGIRPSSARDRIATLLMWRSLNNCAQSEALERAYFRTTVAKTPYFKTSRRSPELSPGARKSAFADTVLQLPDRVMPPGSTFSCVPSFQFQAAQVRPIARRFLAGFFASAAALARPRKIDVRTSLYRQVGFRCK